MMTKSLVCRHLHTKPRLVTEGRRNPVTGRFDGHYVYALSCSDCGAQLPEYPVYLERQQMCG